MNARFTDEQIIQIIKEQEAGERTSDVCRRHGISEGRFCKYKSKYCGAKPSDAKQLRALEGDNAKLKKLLAEQMRDSAAGGRKRALGTRKPMDLPEGPNQRWSMEFVSDAFTDGRRFRILAVVDDFKRENLTLGLVLLQHDPGRLQLLHNLMEALHEQAGLGRTDRLDLSSVASGCDQVQVVHKLRLLGDNGSSDLAELLQDKGMKHSRSAPYHPQTQGKIERWHQTLKNRILLENYFLPGDLEAQIAAFVDHDNHQRHHDSLNNVTPADVYLGRNKAVLAYDAIENVPDEWVKLCARIENGWFVKMQKRYMGLGRTQGVEKLACWGSDGTVRTKLREHCRKAAE